MCFFLSHYVTLDGFLPHSELHYVSLPSMAQGERCSKWLSIALCVREMNDLPEMRHQERRDLPKMGEANFDRGFLYWSSVLSFLLQDFCTRSHKYCHFQLQSVFQLCIAAGGVTQKEDATEELSRIGAALALSVHCVPGLQRGSGPG